MAAVGLLGHFTDRVARALSDGPSAGHRPGRAAKISYVGGDSYEGEACGSTAQPVRHGSGVYHYSASQSRYEGEFLEDEKHGRGTLFYEDGDAYDGQWLNGQQHGHGVHVHWSPKGGVWVYDGEFREGQRAGCGALVARERGCLVGTWVAGRLSRGVELNAPFPGAGERGLEVSVLGALRPEESQPESSGDGAEADEEEEEGEEGEEGEEDEDGGEVEDQAPELPLPRTPLGPSPRNWQAAEVRLLLRALGLEEAPERASLCLSGEQLLGLRDLESLIGQCQVDSGISELAQAWRATLGAAHACLRRAAEEAEGLLASWEELQAALPSVRKRVIPASELQPLPLPSAASSPSPSPAAARHEWRGMPVQLSPLPLQLWSGRGSEEEASGQPRAWEGERACLEAARSWARDLEALATIRHPNLRTLLGVALVPPEDDSPAVPTLVYEASRSGGRLLFEWIHASLPDGSRPPLDFRSELRLAIGLCEALATLSARGLVSGALCSVNVELVNSGGEICARLMNTGVSWWRWGWRGSLRVREAGQRRRALSVEEVRRRYGTCPVNWLAPEVLRGREPSDTSDIYSFGLVLWEMLYRAVPFGDFSIAQIIAAVGYGRRQLGATASPGSSIESSFLHEVVSRCAQQDPAQRPSCAVLLESLRDMLRAYEKRKSRKGVLGLLGKQTGALLASAAQHTDALLSGGQPQPAAAAATRQREPEEAGEQGPRMVRLATGEWVRVDVDLVEQFPEDEEKWRALMAFRARLSPSE